MTQAAQHQTAPQTFYRPSAKSLSDVFNAFAKDAVERFPGLKGQLVIVEMNEGRVYCADKMDLKKTGFLSKSGVEEYIASHPIFIRKREDKNESSCASIEPARNLFIIFSNEHVDAGEFNAASQKKEKELLFILDHELAHLGIAGAFPIDDNLYARVVGESIADAYALIRHYQRFGSDNECSDLVINSHYRACNFVRCNDDAHFTTFVLDEIISRKDQIDFSALDPNKTIDLAWRFAMEYAPPAPVIKMLYGAFEPMRKAYDVSIDEGRRALVEIALDPEGGYYKFKLASRYLREILDDKIDNQGEPIKLRGEYWDDVRKKLKEREFKFAQEDILFNVPVVKPQPKPASNQNVFK